MSMSTEASYLGSVPQPGKADEEPDDELPDVAVTGSTL